MTYVKASLKVLGLKEKGEESKPRALGIRISFSLVAPPESYVPRPTLEDRLAEIGRMTRQSHALQSAHHVLLLVVRDPQRIGQRRAVQHKMVQLMELGSDLPEELTMLNRFVGQGIERTVIHTVVLLSNSATFLGQDRSSAAEGFPHLIEAHKDSSSQAVVARAIFHALAPAHAGQPSDQNHRFLHEESRKQIRSATAFQILPICAEPLMHAFFQSPWNPTWDLK